MGKIVGLVFKKKPAGKQEPKTPENGKETETPKAPEKPKE